MRILVSRTDRIGDVTLTLPLCGLLATELGAEVVFLGRRLTRPVLEASRFVHEILTWDEVEGAPGREQAQLLRAARADVVLHVFPRRAIARAAWRAGIRTRVGTSRRLYHWLYCNRLPALARRASELHEAQLNVRVAEGLLGSRPRPAEELWPFYGLAPAVPLPAAAGAALDPARYNLVLHPRSSGSGKEWPLESWRALIQALDPSRYRALVTGSAAEGESLRPLLEDLPPHAVDLTGKLTLAELIALLGAADGMVAAGTGPLHLAAALGIHTLGLFPPTRPIHPGRWRPLGPRASYLVADAPCPACSAGAGAACTCMRAITPDAVLAHVEGWGERVNG